MKRLIVLCDGTGQSTHRGEKDGFPTNVKTFGDCLEQTFQDRKTKEFVSQVVYYQSGVGTSSVLAVSDTLSEGVGLGIEDNILDAYYFLCSNYEDGDEICIFGFSRGAFTARIVANLVVRLGLLRMNVSWMIRRAWAQYTVNDKGASFEHFLERLHSPEYSGRTRRVKVKVLGVWDTVCAVADQEIYDTRLHWGIENAFHALALDECRTAFGPTLLYLPKEPKPEWIRENINLQQCWFAGAHTDIGGGYPSSHQSNISLAWMIDNCKKRDLLVFNDNSDWHEPLKGIKWKRIINGHHRPGDDKYGSPIRKARRDKLVEDVYPGWGCGVIRDSYKEFVYNTGGVGRWQYREPGNYGAEQQAQQHPGPWGVRVLEAPTLESVKSAASWLNPFSYFQKKEDIDWDKVPVCKEPGCCHPDVGMWDMPGATNETIHATVYKRIEAQKSGTKMMMMEWNPKSLDLFRKDNTGKANVDFNRKQCTDGPDKRFMYKWTGFCLVHKDKKVEMWEERDDDYDGGLMRQLRQRDDAFWQTCPLSDVLNLKYDSWLSEGFELKRYKDDPVNYKPLADRDDVGVLEQAASYNPISALKRLF